MIDRLKADEHMEMIGHAIDGDHFVGFVLDDPRDVFVKFRLPFGMDQAFPVLYCKDKLDVELCVGIGHGSIVPVIEGVLSV